MSSTDDKKKLVLLSLGSNLGNRQANLKKAMGYLTDTDAISIVKVSSMYETEPFGPKEQNWFLNIALLAKTTLSLIELMVCCKSVEYLTGRIKRERWYEREIDVDIIFYDDTIYQTEKLTVPHPLMQERRFVLVPAAEIAPDFIHPVFDCSVMQLLNNCKDNSKVDFFQSYR